MQPIFDRDAPRKPTNLSVNSDLLVKSRELDINLSSLLERALENAIRARRTELWLKENRAAIAAYNQYVEKHGVFSDGVRSF